MAKLNIDEINNALTELNKWKFEDDSITKEFELKDFSTALGFTVQVGLNAEKANHHPDILIHSWNKVRITLSTHSEGGVTEKDFSLAKNIEKLH